MSPNRSDRFFSRVADRCTFLESQRCAAYATSLQQDQAAVEAGLSLPWSNGPVEGSNNRLKFLKRRGYGRANFDLLRRRVLEPT